MDVCPSEDIIENTSSMSMGMVQLSAIFLLIQLVIRDTLY
jgi:hypothetical protein